MKLPVTILLFGIIISSTIFCQSKIINVPNDFPKIQLAIESAESGDTILVAPGKYNENIKFRGKEIVLTSQFYIHMDMSFILSTEINGGGRGAGDSASVVIFAKNETNNSILQGFTLTGGRGTKTYNTVERLYFRTGGGILIDRASPTIRYNIITKNESINKAGVTGAGGGGIRAGKSKAVITNNIITENKGGYAGGVMLAFCSGLTFSNNVVSNNSADGDFGGGSGIYVDWENVPIINCTVTNNYSDYHGGAICITGTNNVIQNSIIFGNTSNDTKPVQIFKRKGGNATISYTNIYGGYVGIGNINEDPNLVDDHFFHLNEISPCIDAGNPDNSFMDPEGNISGKAAFPSMGTRKNDMGAYGGPNSKSLTSNITSIEKEKSIPTSFNLEQNYPNPFNPSTIIKYSILLDEKREPLPTGRQSENVKLLVYDVLGKKVGTIVNEKQNQGNYEIAFDGTNLSSGVYYYQLRVGEIVNAKKMILLK